MARNTINLQVVADQQHLTINFGEESVGTGARRVFVCEGTGVWLYAVGKEAVTTINYSSRWEDALHEGRQGVLDFDIILVGPEKRAELLAFLKNRFPQADLRDTDEEYLTLP